MNMFALSDADPGEVESDAGILVLVPSPPPPPPKKKKKLRSILIQ